MRRLAALGLIIPVAAGGLALVEGFDGLYGQDPFAYFEYATGPLRRSLLDLQAPPPFFWPPGYPLLVALTSLVLGPTPLAGQLVSLVAGALVPVFTVLLAREVWPAVEGEMSGRPSTPGTPLAGSARSGPGFPLPLDVPLVAGLLVASTGQLWQSSVVVMADTLGLATATAGIWAVARYGRRRELRWLLLAAALMASATLTRWIYGVVAIPCTVYALQTLFRHPRPGAALAHAGAAAVIVGAILAPVLVPAAGEALRQNSGFWPFAGNFQVYRWNPLWALDREFITADGRLIYPRPTGFYYAAAPARWAYFTPLLAPLILSGAWVVHRRRAAAPVFLLLGWAAAVYAFHAGAAYQNFRFTLAYLPPLAILAAIGARVVLDRILQLRSPGTDAGIDAGPGRHPPRRAPPPHLHPWARRLALPLAVGGFALGLALMMAAGAHTTRTLMGNKTRSLEVVRWTEAQVPAEGRLVTFDLTSTFRWYSRLPTLELYEQDPGGLAALLAEADPVFLLVDRVQIEGQWAEESPGRNVRWLEGGPGLAPLGEAHGFTLYRVGPGSFGNRGER